MSVGGRKERMQRKNDKNYSCFLVSVDDFPKSPYKNAACQLTYCGSPCTCPLKSQQELLFSPTSWTLGSLYIWFPLSLYLHGTISNTNRMVREPQEVGLRRWTFIPLLLVRKLARPCQSSKYSKCRKTHLLILLEGHALVRMHSQESRCCV